MKKTGFIFGCISVLLGCMTMIVVSILDQIVPKILHIKLIETSLCNYTSEMYELNFSSANSIAEVLIIVGILLSIYFYISDRRTI